MSAGTPQPISGVSAGREATIETLYPSIAAAMPGRLIGSLCDLIPISLGGIKLSHLLFGPLVIPFALLGYVHLKLFGNKYVLTNRSVQVWRAFGTRRISTTSLADIDDVAIQIQPGQEFYHAGDLVLLKANGEPLATLSGVPRPARFCHAILEARDARQQSDASLSVIQARQPQPV